jgi:hypothetical protein
MNLKVFKIAIYSQIIEDQDEEVSQHEKKDDA